MWYYTELVNTLSGLYYRTNAIEALLLKAKLPLSAFLLDGESANVIWTLAIRRIDDLNRIDNILDATLADYPNHPVIQDYKNKVNVVRKNVYAGGTLHWKGTPGAREKITGAQSTLLPIGFLELGMNKANAVVRIVTPEGLGTGFLVSNEGLLLTNNHVLPRKDIADKSRIQFNYQETMAGLPAEVKEFTIDDSVFETSALNDWSLVKVKDCPAAMYGHLTLSSTPVKKDDFVNIIQHPGGGFKQLGLYHNLVTYADSNIIQYLTDTLPGSSGSPVFNSKWEVVALHHSGGWITEPNNASPVLRNEGINVDKIRNSLLLTNYQF